MAQEALLSLALPSRRAERPSTSRRLTSLPSVAPTIRPSEETASTTSGSGLFQEEFGWMPASMPVPTAAIGWHLVKISASGPMPTSRYWLQAPCWISTSFRCAASGEPGFRLLRSSPTRRVISSRIAPAAFMSPRARSSMTRSSMEMAKVTPAALIAWRSMGVSSQGRVGSRVSGGVLASKSVEGANRFPDGCAQGGGGVRGFAEVAHGGIDGRDILNGSVTDHDDGRAGLIRPPDPPGEARLSGVIGQGGSDSG